MSHNYNVVHFVAGGAPSAPPGGSGEPALPPYRPSAPPGRPYYGGVVNQQPNAQPFPHRQDNNAYLMVKPPNYFPLTVVATFCCCLVCGAIGLYFGHQVNSYIMVSIYRP